jgi:RNA polymerase sigma-70 factor, ECF subfamily
MSALLAQRVEHHVLDSADPWFAGFYERTFDSVYRFAWLLTRDAGLAEDVVFSAYLRAWANRRSLVDTTSALRWLLNVVGDRTTELSRSRKAIVEQTAEQNPFEALSGSPVLTPDQRQAVQEAIALLTPDQQQVIFLRFFQHMEHERVARELGRTEKSVRALQFRALERLRTLLEANGAR